MRPRVLSRAASAATRRYKANMRLPLYPDVPCTALRQVEVDVARPSPGRLIVHYFVFGRIRDLRVPPVTTSARADELWQRTCFEAFVRPLPSDAYYEFNFSPSTQWAAYRFSAYRADMTAAYEVRAPGIDVQSSGALYELRAALDLDDTPGLPSDAAWRLGLSVVTETTRGEKSHWALAHPHCKADFHHPDCFAHELPAVSGI
jgi:hypothetical protein